MVGRTSFVIAHRLSTIFDADQIFVVENGHIREHEGGVPHSHLRGERGGDFPVRGQGIQGYAAEESEGICEERMSRTMKILCVIPARYASTRLPGKPLADIAGKPMEKHQPRPITVLPVIDENQQPVGIVHLTDLLRQGVV